MILLCPVTCWAQRKIIIMIRKKQPNSILFLQWAICLPSDLSLAQHLQKGDHLGGGGETLATSKAIRTGWPWEVLGPLQASGGGIAHGLRICGVWNAHSCLWVRFQLSLHQFVEVWPLLNLLQGPQSHYDGWSNPYLAYNPGRTPHHLQDSPCPWHPLPLATLTLPLSFNTCIPYTHVMLQLRWTPYHSLHVLSFLPTCHTQPLDSSLGELLLLPRVSSSISLWDLVWILFQDGVSLIGSQVLFLHTSSWAWRHEMAWCRRKATASSADGADGVRRCGARELWTGAGPSL